jgi:hypothetical protein
VIARKEHAIDAQKAETSSKKESGSEYASPW